ncbi:MAG: DUF4251 domain-containing protein [Winogradskyella sp.]
MKKITQLIVVFCFAITLNSYAQQSVSQKDKFEATYNHSKAITKSQNYTFVGEWIVDGKKREQLDGNINKIKISKSNSSGRLNLFKKENKTIDFNGAIKNYKVVYNDNNQRVSISYKIKDIKVAIEIAMNGNAFLKTTFNDGNTISYVGQLK